MSRWSTSSPSRPRRRPKETADTLTAAAALSQTAARLARQGVERPRSEALLLVARALETGRASIVAHPERILSPGEAGRLEELVSRRERREPFAQIVGQREFYGLELTVDARVLTPRPETETLVDATLDVLKAARARGTERPLVVDVGTGSGAVALALAAHAPFAQVVGADLSAEALSVAGHNCRRLSAHGGVALVRGDLLAWLRGGATAIAANLPYLPSGRIGHLMPEVARFEPRIALDGGRDGLDLVRRLALEAERTLDPGGSLLLELDPPQIGPARALLPGWRATVFRDLAGCERVLRLDKPE